MSNQLSYLLVALIIYAGASRLILMMRMAAKGVPVPWLTLGVPLHLFQACRKHRETLGSSCQWWSLSTDLALLTLFGLVFAGLFQPS